MMSGENSQREEKVPTYENRAVWEKPALRRLAANEASGGMGPRTDGRSAVPGTS